MKVYSGTKGIVFLMFFVGAIFLILSILSWGMTAAIELFLPLLVAAGYLLIAVFLFGVLPASYFKDLRPRLVLYTTFMAQLLGVLTWMVSFFYVVKSFGAAAMFLALFLQFLAPLALIGALIKKAWWFAINLGIWIGASYGMKFYAQWLLQKFERPGTPKGDIIDVDAIEVK